MAKRRITRKQMKEMDKFQTRAEKATVWIAERGWKKVVGFIVLIGLLMLALIFVNNMLSTQRTEASGVYGEALNMYIRASQPSATEYIANKEKLQNAISKFQEVIDKYDSTAYAEMAKYYIVLCYFKLGKKERGFEDGEKLFADTSEDIVQNLIGFFLIDKYIKEEKYKEARRLVEELESENNDYLNPNQLLYVSGKIYERQNMIDKATEEYLKIIENEEYAAYRIDARERLRVINPKALEDKMKTFQ